MNDAFAAIGFVFALPCLICGAYGWWRWGWTGWAVIWQRRTEIDEQVRAALPFARRQT